MDKRFLDQCEREALHLSGAIQPHGALLILDAAGRITHASANVGQFIGGTATDWLGQEVPEMLASSLTALAAEPGSRLVREAAIEGGTGWLGAVIQRGQQNAVLIELTFSGGKDDGLGNGLALTCGDPPRDDDQLAEQRQALIEHIMLLTDFQRVMYYQFFDDGDGEVIHETRQDEAYGSYLGHRFPASDIPQIARILYLKNPWRLIPDATVEPIPLIGEGPADLTYTDLRSVSPIHRVYLANMGVRASLSFPVIVGGHLDALIAAHHRAARRPALAVLEHAAMCVQRYAFGATSLRVARRMRLIDSLTRRFDLLRETLQRHGALVAALGELCPWLMEEFAANGVMILRGEVVATSGEYLEPEALATFDAWFCQQRDLVWAGDSLRRQVPHFPFSAIAGVLAIRIHQPDGQLLRVYLCRHEFVEEVIWGGNPQKPVEYYDGELGIAPRRSFEKWVEKRLGYSRPWDNETRLLAMKLRELLNQEIGWRKAIQES